MIQRVKMKVSRSTLAILSLAGLGAAALVLFVLFPQIVSVPSAADNRPTNAIIPRDDRPKYVSGFVLDKQTGLMWAPDLEWALAKAKNEKKRVFVAFDGLISANSRFNQVKVLGVQPVKDALLQHVLVTVYADAIPQEFYQEATTDEQREADAEVNQKFLADLVDAFLIPAYAILDPVDATHFRVGAVWNKGRILDVDEFRRFVIGWRSVSR